MKRLKLILLTIFIILCGCEDHMDDIKPYSIITSQSMWKNEGDAKAGIAGMYDQFRSTFNGRNYLYWFELRSGFWSYGESGGGAGTGVWEDLFFNDLNTSTSPGTDWASLYKTINSANLALKYIPEIKFSSEIAKKRLLADAYFVRAFTYFTLARIYGDVPIVIKGFESADAEDLYPERKPVSDVFTQIKSDISDALNHIPDNDSRGRVLASIAAINMLKADVYLWTAKRMNEGTTDLNAAEAAVDQILSNSNYQLLDSYEQVFRIEQNEEIIFSLYFDISEEYNQYGNQFAFQVAVVPEEYHNNPVLIGSHAQWFTFTDHYVNNYLMKQLNDSRRDVINRDFDSGDRNFRWINKYPGDWSEGNRNFVSDTRIYRFAESILFKAEILNSLGNTSEAISYLNQIAKRAYGIDDYYPSTLTQAEVDDAILDERLIEFGAEGKSWFDIIRLGKAFERISSLVGREGENQGNILLFPISPNTITLNPKITQTHGY